MDQLFNIISAGLVLALVVIALKYLGVFGGYKIDEPYKWEEAVKTGLVSPELIELEKEYFDKIRFFSMWFQIERLKKLKVAGDFAELGVHKGETAKIIHHMDSSRKLHLFDTFEGFNEKDLALENQKEEKFSTKEFSDTDLETVKEYIGAGEKAVYYRGYFPSTAVGLNATFAFVHLDADLYLPTIEGLRFFYPKLSAGGVIIIHDYNHTWEGIPKAIEEFVATIPESLIELPDWKGSVMIVKNSK